MRKFMLGAAVVLSTALLPIAPAFAEPQVGRRGTDDQVETVVTAPGSPGSEAQGGGAVQAGSGGGGGAPACTYTALTPEQALAAGLRSPDDGGVDNVQRTDGSYVSRDCTASGGGRTVLWVPAGDGAGPAGVPAVTPAMLAQEARNSLQLPTPTVGVNPDGANGNPALVNLPTWWWVTNGDSLTQRTAVGSVWAEVTAEPVSSTWVTGVGERTECVGLGFAWVRGMDDYERGSCSHTYRQADADEQAEVQVVWRVSWVGSGGSGGTLDPFTMTATQDVPVYERQAIVTTVD